MTNISDDKPEIQPDADADEGQRILDAVNIQRKRHGMKLYVRGDPVAEALIAERMAENAKFRRQMARWKRSHEREGR